MSMTYSRLSSASARLLKLLRAIEQCPACPSRSLLHQSAISLADFAPDSVEAHRTGQIDSRGSAQAGRGDWKRDVVPAGRERESRSSWPSGRQRDRFGTGAYGPTLASIPRTEAELCQALTELGDRKDKPLLKRTFASCVQRWESSAERQGPRISRRTLLLYLSELIRAKEPVVGLKGMANRVKNVFGIDLDLAVYNKFLESCHAAKEPAHMAMSLLDEMKVQGVAPDMESYMWAFMSCVRDVQHIPAIRVLALVKEAGLEVSSTADRQEVASGLQSLLVNLSKDGAPESCLQVIATMQEHGFQPQPHHVQECMQTAVDVHKPGVALKLLEVLTGLPDPEGGPGGVQVVEGQCLALLNCAALHGHGALTHKAWDALQNTLQGPHQVPGDDQRRSEATRPLGAFYHAYIHALAASGDLRGAFRIVGQLEAAYPTWPEVADWHGALGCVVDACAQSLAHVDQAYYHLESMLADGEVVTQAMADCVLAACSQIGDIGRAFETFEAYTALQLRPGTNTYNAVLAGCIQNNLLESVPKILAEMQQERVGYNAHTRALLVSYHIVERNPEGILEALDDMTAHEQQPSLELLESAMARLEREGHREGIRRLSHEVGTSNWRAFNAASKVARWKDNGGMVALTNSHKFLLRPNDIQGRNLDRVLR